MIKKSPLVSIIIVNFNGQEVLLECLNSLKKVNYKNIEMIIVDNGSTDTSLEGAKKIFQSVHILQNKNNIGFASANNQGAKLSKGEYLLFLNNDTIVTPDFLTKMVDKMQADHTIGAMQPKIYMMDRKNYLDNAGSFLTKTGFLQHWGFASLDSKEFNNEKAIFSAKGACLLTRSKVVEMVGLFDDKFESYFEESDFCWRIWLTGWKVIFYPNAKIFHRIGYTSKKMSQIDVNYHSIKNRIRSLLKNLSNISLLTIFVTHIILVIGLGIFYLFRLQISKFEMIAKALIWNSANLRDTLSRRRKIQKLRTVTDKEIFTQVLVSTNLNEMARHFRKVEKNFK